MSTGIPIITILITEFGKTEWNGGYQGWGNWCLRVHTCKEQTNKSWRPKTQYTDYR